MQKIEKKYKVTTAVRIEDTIPDNQFKNSTLYKCWKDEQLDYNPKLFDSLIEENCKPEERGFIRFVCISDTHGQFKDIKLPKGDVLIHCGDFSSKGSKKEIKEFSKWLGKQDFLQRVVIAGNHEFSFDLEYEEILKERFSYKPTFPSNEDFKEVKSLLTNCIYLEDQETDIFGYKVYGTPWQNEYSRSAFQRKPEICDSKFDKIPKNIDILISHSPPYGFCDEPSKAGIDHAGSKYLAQKVCEDIKPIVHVFGHLHEAYGVKFGGSCGTIFANVASCNRAFRIEHRPVIFDLPIKQK